MKTCQDVWRECLIFISSRVSEDVFDTWFNPISPEKLQDGVLILRVPNKFFTEWLEEHYINILLEATKEVLGVDVKIKYVTNKDIQQKDVTVKSNQTSNICTNHSEFIKSNFLDSSNISGLNPKYSFDNFIEGDCNVLARSSALSVAKKPFKNVFNPLMIYGGVGLGKTHLLNAIGNYVKQNFKDKAVFYMQTTVFVNQFIKSILAGKSQDFTNFYLNVDVLLLDDVQFLKDKDKTQEKLFYIFNELHQMGKQIVLSSDQSPNELNYLQGRLVSRFKWGATVDLTVPDLETRIAILKSKVTENCEIDDSIIEYIAKRVDSNVRELEGVMITAIANTSSEHNIDIDSIQKIINNILTNDVEVDRISQAVADYFELSIEDIFGKSRQKDIALARQIAMYLARQYTECSLKKIGETIGGRDHTTVLHAINTIENLIKNKENIKKTVDNINKDINNKLKIKKKN